jgi:endonuclease-3
MDKYIKKVFDTLAEEYGDEELTELDYINPYTLLVATMLSAQATDKMVNRVTEKLFAALNNPTDMRKLGENRLREYIKSINYFNTKAKNIIKMSEQLIERFDSRVPNTMEDLTSLAGVGRKTASIILNIVYHKRAIAVDTHVFRLANRIGLVKCKNTLATEKELLKTIPGKYIKYVNNYLVLLGRRICKARAPDCGRCSLGNICKKCGVGDYSISLNH